MKYVIVNIRDLVYLVESGFLDVIKSLKIVLYISDFAIANCCGGETKIVEKLVKDEILKTERLNENEIGSIYQNCVIEGISIVDVVAVFLCVKLKGVLLSNDILVHKVRISEQPIVVQKMDYFINNLKMKKAG